jgi:hypothetical protein
VVGIFAVAEAVEHYEHGRIMHAFRLSRLHEKTAAGRPPEERRILAERLIELCIIARFP